MTDFDLRKQPSGKWEVWEQTGWGGSNHLKTFDRKTDAVSATEDLLRKEPGVNRMVIKTNGVIRETITYIDGVEQ